MSAKREVARGGECGCVSVEVCFTGVGGGNTHALTALSVRGGWMHVAFR